jgi:hypothetical protein
MNYGLNGYWIYRQLTAAPAAEELNPWQAKVEALPVELEPAIEAASDSLPAELEITDPDGFAREVYRIVTGEES